MLVTALWLWALCYLVHAQNETSCKSDYRYIDSDETINITTSTCTIIPCITKCCPANQVFLYHEAHDTTDCFDNVNITFTFNISNLDDYSEVPIYNKHVKRNAIKTKKKIENFTIIYSESFHTSSYCSIDIIQRYPPPKPLMYIIENGYLVMRKLNYYNQWVSETAPGEFCVEHQVVLNADGVASKPQLVIRILIDNDVEDEEEPRDAILAYGMVVSCVFLVLVLVVYALLPELRNLAGLLLMAYVATLFSAFLFRIVQVFASENGPLEKTTCIWLGFIAYYTAVASFTWMNVMSFDIWWAMRGFRKLGQTHRRGKLVKLCWYGFYGWGAPLLPIIFMIVVENIDMTHLPDFVTPHYSDPNICFIEEEERQLYMNGPILITLCMNITLFLLTAYNIWRIKRGVSQHSAGDSRRNKSDETRFCLYLKIALVMGINWIMEIMSSLYEPDSMWWYIIDLFNSLIGIFIFIIFICKRNVIVLLCKRFSIGDKLRKWQPVDSKCFDNSQVNSRRKILDSVTESSDVDDLGKSPSNQLVAEF